MSRLGVDSHSFGGARWASVLVGGILHFCQWWGLTPSPGQVWSHEEIFDELTHRWRGSWMGSQPEGLTGAEASQCPGGPLYLVRDHACPDGQLFKKIS